MLLPVPFAFGCQAAAPLLLDIVVGRMMADVPVDQASHGSLRRLGASRRRGRTRLARCPGVSFQSVRLHVRLDLPIVGSPTLSRLNRFGLAIAGPIFGRVEHE